MQTEVVTQYIQPVTEVMVLQTFTFLPNTTYNGTFTNGTSNGTSNGNVTAPRNHTLPASLNPEARRFPTATVSLISS